MSITHLADTHSGRLGKSWTYTFKRKLHVLVVWPWSNFFENGTCYEKVCCCWVAFRIGGVCLSILSFFPFHLLLLTPVTIIRTSRPCTENWIDSQKGSQRSCTHTICLSIIGRRVLVFNFYFFLLHSPSILLSRMCANVFISYCDLAASIRSNIPLVIISSTISSNRLPIATFLSTWLTFFNRIIRFAQHWCCVWLRRMRQLTRGTKKSKLWDLGGLQCLQLTEVSSSSHFLYWAHLWSLNCTFFLSHLLCCCRWGHSSKASPLSLERTFLSSELAVLLLNA